MTDPDRSDAGVNLGKDPSSGAPPVSDWGGSGAPPTHATPQNWGAPTAGLGVGSASGLPADIANKKLVAGILGILLGSLGVHKFYLGNTQPGIVMLAGTLGGYFLGFLLAIILVGFVFFLVPVAMGIIGLIEGILYLTKSDQEFYQTYVVGKKAWL